MNDGKICISICAKTADEAFEKAARAEPLADVIELRFDCLDPAEIKPAVAKAAEWGKTNSNNLLATFRTLEQGGKRELTNEERSNFWFTGNDTVFWGGDFEEDIIKDSFDWHWLERICSSHNFSPAPQDVKATFARLHSSGASHIKIAIQAEQINDAISLWKLLKEERPLSRPLIPVAMGEAGKWTRILGLAHGAFMTYASLESGAETAPGQISAEDMIDVFRVKELDENTEVYGIVAGDTSYSVSPWMHNAGFRSAEMNRVFVPLQVADLDDFVRRMVNPETREIDLNFRGFSVTTPHKQAIMRHLDKIDETAATIGAVNTVKIENGKLYGYNTDAPGFIAPLKNVFSDLKSARVAVVGAGGAARACIYALREEGADVTLFARDEKKAKPIVDEFGIDFRQFEISNLKSQISNLRSVFAGFDILVNATPLGTKGEKQNETVAMADQLKNVKLVYDLIYNPLETRLIHEAKAAGVEAIGGLEMLIAQGAKQFEIWTGESAPVDAMAEAVKKKLNL